MSPKDWPVATPPSEMRDRVGTRAAQLRRTRVTRRMAVTASALVFTMAAAYLAWTPSESALRTTAADAGGSGGDELPAAAATSGADGPGGPAPGHRPGSKGGSVGGPVPTVPPTPATTTTTTAPVPRVSGGDIAFVRDQRIWLTQADGTGTGPLTEGTRKFDSPSWAPDGTRLVAIEELGTDVTAMPVSRVVEVRLDGSVRAITGEGVYGAPVWAPDSSYIAFTRMASWTPLRFELWTMRPDGSNERRIADKVSGEASWSPDGSKLVAAVGTEDGDGCLCTMNPDGSDRRAIPVAVNHGAPAWSPDGQRIALSYLDETGRSQVVTVRVDGSNRRVVTDGEAIELDWSPDSTTLVFVEGTGEAGPRLARVDGDGSDRRVVTSGYAHRLSWRRN